MEPFIKKVISEHAVAVFSKSYCPYCHKVKDLFASLGVKPPQLYVIELDKDDNGSAIQQSLKDLTGQSTVPNVFIGGKHVGGNDATQKLNSEGKLGPMLSAAHAL
eukprot:Phypoly_transcript_27029.p1 GENE.Phypoly_transcript_27029~~Phypoly_transcript_27029.p1  ORF type:complete len:105 (+),score=21.43 Phypoly_transcript_27029:113-427(+)